MKNIAFVIWLLGWPIVSLFFWTGPSVHNIHWGWIAAWKTIVWIGVASMLFEKDR